MEYTENFIGNELAIRYLQGLLYQQRLPVTQLWYGPEHSGKNTLVNNLAFWLLCERRQPDDFTPCLQCHSCTLLLHNHHPNVFVYESVAGNTIHKQSITDGITQWQRTPLLNTSRIVIITTAEALTEEAANALLKVLEEPNAQVYFILCTSHIERVLPTIISRCAQLSFSAKSATQVVNKELLIHWVDILQATSFGRRLQLVNEIWPKLQDRQELQQHLMVLAVLSRTVLLLQYNITSIQFTHAGFNSLAKQYTAQQSLAGILAIATASRALLHQAQPKLIIEQILLSLYYPL